MTARGNNPQVGDMALVGSCEHCGDSGNHPSWYDGCTWWCESCWELQAEEVSL